MRKSAATRRGPGLGGKGLRGRGRSGHATAVGRELRPHLVELTPQDTARIEAAASHVIGELKATPDTFYDRNRRQLERIGRSLTAWNKDKQHAAAMQRIRARMTGVCAKLPAADPAHVTCDGALHPAPARNDA